MKIKEDIIQNLQAVLEEYIAEYGPKYGKYMFSRELGALENRLYTEAKKAGNMSDFELISCLQADSSGEVEGELAAAEEDSNSIPFLEVV